MYREPEEHSEVRQIQGFQLVEEEGLYLVSKNGWAFYSRTWRIDSWLEEASVCLEYVCVCAVGQGTGRVAVRNESDGS